MQSLAFAALVSLALADTCVPPYAGQPVMSLSCSTPGATLAVSKAASWDANFGGQITVPGGFCFTVNSTAMSSDNEPAIVLQPCSTASPLSPFQLFAELSSSGNSTYASHVDGSCLDLVSGTQAPNEQLELYGCSGNANQCVAPLLRAAAALAAS
jgi:hypothetical protein